MCYAWKDNGKQIKHMPELFMSVPYLHSATLLGILDKHTICEGDLHKSWPPPPPPIISSPLFLSPLPSQCLSVCHGECLSKQTDDSLRQPARCEIVCFWCSHADESFLKSVTEVQSWAEGQKNKYLLSSLAAPWPFSVFVSWQKMNGFTFGCKL